MKERFKNCLWLCCLLLSLLSGRQAAAQSLEEYLTTISALTQAEKYADALVLTEKALESYPRNLRLLTRHAYLEDSRGNREQAIGEMLSIRDLYPNNDTVLNSLGDFFLHSGYLDSAMVCYRQTLYLAKDRTDSFIARLNIGSVYLYQRDYKTAISHYEAMLPLFGDSVGVLNNLAEAYSHEGRRDQAIAMLKRIVSQNPDFTHAYSNLGMLYTEDGDYEAASKSFQNGLLLEPENPYLLNNYGHLLYKMKDYGKALKNINLSIAKYPGNAYAYRNRALVYLAMNLIREACSDLKASRELGFSVYYGDEVDNLLLVHGCGE